MQIKMTDGSMQAFAPFETLFQSPGRYVQQLQAAGPMAWLKVLAAASACYAIFGLSIALAPSSQSTIAAIWVTPLIFLIAQLVSLPALYIFHAFLGSKLTPQQVAATGMVALLIPGVLLAGMAPINWFMLASIQDPSQLLWLQRVTILGVAILGYVELFNTLPSVELPLATQAINPIAARARRSKITHPATKEAQKRRLLLLVWVFLYMGVLYKVMKLFGQTSL